MISGFSIFEYLAMNFIDGIATVVLLLTSIWLIFSYLGTDFHLRRPPVWGYVVIGSVVTLSLLMSRFAMESIAYDPKKFLVDLFGCAYANSVYYRQNTSRGSEVIDEH